MKAEVTDVQRNLQADGGSTGLQHISMSHMMLATVTTSV